MVFIPGTWATVSTRPLNTERTGSLVAVWISTPRFSTTTCRSTGCACRPKCCATKPRATGQGSRPLLPAKLDESRAVCGVSATRLARRSAEPAQSLRARAGLSARRAAPPRAGVGQARRAGLALAGLAAALPHPAHFSDLGGCGFLLAES
uniref:Uncharacterized protein n=1 Tax=Tanacetum cinerariifolium TaxID=118510 RepID=A0A699U2R3_TANCI|nr:hypothetical protein [Tanacetum cinerariifolium]